MKYLISLTLALLMGIAAVGIQSCGNNEKDEPEAPLVTDIDFSKSDAIIGRWFQTEILWEDGTKTKSDDRTIIFNADGTFEYTWGTGGIYSAKGNYTYKSSSRNKGVASGNDGQYSFTFENYEEYRYKVSIKQPAIGGVVNVDAVGIFGHLDK